MNYKQFTNLQNVTTYTEIQNMNTRPDNSHDDRLFIDVTPNVHRIWPSPSPVHVFHEHKYVFAAY